MLIIKFGKIQGFKSPILEKIQGFKSPILEKIQGFR